MRHAFSTSVILALLTTAAPAVSATRALDAWTALAEQQAPAQPDLYLQVRNAIDWQKPAMAPTPAPAVLGHVLQVYAAVVAAVLLAKHLPVARRVAQVEDAAEARSRTR